MGCTQSKTNEKEVVNPNVNEVEVPVQPVEENVTADRNEAPVDATETVEAETEPTPVMETPTVEVKSLDFALQFVPGEVSINEYGVAFYNFDGSNPADPSQDVHVCKRYSEFKDMHAEISKLMVSEKNVKASDQDKFQTYPALPEMPKANVWTHLRGRYNEKVLEEREEQFARILNAISRHPVAFQSRQFTAFLQA